MSEQETERMRERKINGKRKEEGEKQGERDTTPY